MREHCCNYFNTHANRSPNNNVSFLIFQRLNFGKIGKLEEEKVVRKKQSNPMISENTFDDEKIKIFNPPVVLVVIGKSFWVEYCRFKISSN